MLLVCLEICIVYNLRRQKQLENSSLLLLNTTNMDFITPSTLTAISPLDGRYWSKVNSLSPYFSEFGLIRYRVEVEIEYFIELSSILSRHAASTSNNNTKNASKSALDHTLSQSPEKVDEMRSWYRNFKEEDALRVKEIEKTTNHDVKVRSDEWS